MLAPACRTQFMTQHRDKRNKCTSVDNMWVKLEENPDNVYRARRWNRKRYVSVTYVDNYVYQSDKSIRTREDTREDTVRKHRSRAVVTFQLMRRHGVRCEYFVANSNFANFLNMSAFNTNKSGKSMNASVNR